MALSVTPVLGFTGVAGADEHLEAADPIGEGNFCEDVPMQEPFTDVQTTDPSYEEIVCLVATEVTTGVTATTYEPNSFVTRRQMALFLTRVAEEANRLEIGDNINELPEPAANEFDDVQDEEEFIQDAISQIAQAEIAEGFPDGDYRPAAPVSRRQMAAFIDRLYEYLTGEALPRAAGDNFEDDDADSAEAQSSTNAVAEAGIFIGNTDGTFAPAQEITRRQMANVLTRTFEVLFENGEIDQWRADEAPAESLINVDPATPAVLTVSGTKGTATGDRALREYTINVDPSACDAIDVALIPFTNITDNGDGTFTFQDVDGQANRADGLGGTDARIESVNGVQNSIVDGNDYVNNVSVPANREVTVTVNSQTANQAVALVAFCDSDNNNQLNLDVDNVPTEEFGLGGVQLIVPAEADDLQAGATNVILDLDILNLFTDTDNLFNYDDNDEFDYASGPITLGNLTEAEFGEWLSGVETGQITDADLQSGLRGFPLGAGTVFGDAVTYTYRTDPANVSNFTIVRDVPAAPTNVTTTVSDPDADGATEVFIEWDGVSNPDLEGYNVFAQEIINGIPTGNWFLVNDDIVEGESFVGEIDAAGSPFESDTTYEVVVLAENSFGDYGPDSNLATVEVPAVESTIPLVSEEIVVTDAGTGNELDDDDTVRIEFNQDVSFAAGASITVKDLGDGETATLTSGANALFQVGPSNTLTVTLQADLVPAGGVSGDTIIDPDYFTIQSTSGISATDNGIAWHLPGSGIDDDSATFGVALNALNADSLTRVSDETDNDDLSDHIDVSDITAEDDSAVLTIDDDADGASDIEQGDTVQVFDLAGTLVGSTTWDSTVGAQINIGQLPANTPLVVQYIDRNFAGTNTNVASESTLIFVAGDAPTVAGVATVDLNTTDVTWTLPNPPISQVGAPSNYQVFDEDNTDLIATGTNAVVIDDDTIRVDWDANLVPGTSYTLRVAANTVQNNNNVPNVAQAVPFVFQPVPVPDNPAPPTMTSAVVNVAADTIVVTYSEDVTCDAATAPFTYDDQSDADDDDGNPTSVTQGLSNTCVLQFTALENDDFGQLTYLQPANAGDRIVDSQGQEALSQSIGVQDAVAPSIDSVTAAAAGTNTVTVTMTEAIRCADLGNDDFEVRVDGEANSRGVTVDAATCTAPNDATFELDFDGSATAAGAVVTVTAVPANTLRDQAGNNQVADSATDTVA